MPSIKMTIAIFSATVLFISHSVLFAEVSMETYSKIKDDKTFHSYILGIGKGYSYANAHLKSIGKPLIYCVPEGFKLQTENYLQILNRMVEYTEAKTNMNTWPSWARVDLVVEPLLLLGLID